jgi:hypothetical protein
MAICYIEQTEVYNSSPQTDRLSILNAPSSASLLEDLNYIRSVIFNIIGTNPTNSANTWYKVPFYNLTALYNYYSSFSSDFSVEHFTSTANPAKAGQHKDTNVNGYLKVTGYAQVAGSLTSGSQNINGNEDVTGYSHVVGNLTTDANLSVGYDTNIGRDLLVGRHLTVTKNTTLGDFTLGTETKVNTRTTYLNSLDTIHNVLNSSIFNGFSNVFVIPDRYKHFVTETVKIGGSSYVSFLESMFEDSTQPVLAKTEVQAAMDSSQNYVVQNFFLYKDKLNYYRSTIGSNAYKKEYVNTTADTSTFPEPTHYYNYTSFESVNFYDGGFLASEFHFKPTNMAFMLGEKHIRVASNLFIYNKRFFYFNPSETINASNNYSPSLIDFAEVKKASYANIFYKLGVASGTSFYNILKLTSTDFTVFTPMTVAGAIYSQGSVSLPVVTL